jgi:hypothetical protein
LAASSPLCHLSNTKTLPLPSAAAAWPEDRISLRYYTKESFTGSKKNIRKVKIFDMISPTGLCHIETYQAGQQSGLRSLHLNADVQQN